MKINFFFLNLKKKNLFSCREMCVISVFKQSNFYFWQAEERVMIVITWKKSLSNTLSLETPF